MRGHRHSVTTTVKERRPILLPTQITNLTGWYKADAISAARAAVHDSFSEANGTNLNGKQTEGGGKTWTVVIGTAEINTGQVKPLTVSPSMSATVDAGYSDFDMSVVITTGSTLIDGFIFRFVDTSNYIRLDIDNSADNLVLIKNVAGTESQITSASVPGMAIGNVATYRVVCVGSNIKIYRDGGLQINTTDAAHQTATKHGIISGSTATRFDNFSLAPDPTITTWADSSGQSNDLTVSGSARPTLKWNHLNGLPMVEFDGVDDYISRTGDPWSTGTGSAQMFVVAIWRITGRSVVGSFPDKHAFRDGFTFWRTNSGSASVTITAPPLNQPVIMGYRFDGGAAARMQVNGRQVGETANGSTVGASTSWAIGGDNGSGGPPPNSFFSGYVGEVIIYNRELTNFERSGVEQYLANKWLDHGW